MPTRGQAALSAVSNYWANSLSTDEIDFWNNLGRDFRLSGLNMFLRYNMDFWLYGSDIFPTLAVSPARGRPFVFVLNECSYYTSTATLFLYGYQPYEPAPVQQWIGQSYTFDGVGAPSYGLIGVDPPFDTTVGLDMVIGGSPPSFLRMYWKNLPEGYRPGHALIMDIPVTVRP